MSRKTNKKDCSFAKFLTGLNINNDFDDSGTNQFFAIFITEAEEESLTKKTKKKTSTTYERKKRNNRTKSLTIYTLPIVKRCSFQTDTMTQLILQTKKTPTNLCRVHVTTALAVHF